MPGGRRSSESACPSALPRCGRLSAGRGARRQIAGEVVGHHHVRQGATRVWGACDGRLRRHVGPRGFSHRRQAPSSTRSAPLPPRGERRKRGKGSRGELTAPPEAPLGIAQKCEEVCDSSTIPKAGFASLRKAEAGQCSWAGDRSTHLGCFCRCPPEETQGLLGGKTLRCGVRPGRTTLFSM